MWLYKKKIPDMDIISCGSINKNLHSPYERMNKKSFEEFFEIVSCFLAEKNK